LCLGSCFAINGVDVSSLVSVSSFGCLKSNGYSFAVMRCYQSIGSVDPNCAATVKNAWDAGLDKVDVYLFPCYKCGNAAGQVDALVKYLTDNTVKHGMIWLDVEGPGVYWSDSTTANRAFFGDLVTAAKSHSVSLGIYTSESQWDPIFGSDYDGGKAYPLWYAHYDNVQSFSDFAAFGGWTKPDRKQYAGDVTLCSAGIDKNWTP